MVYHSKGNLALLLAVLIAGVGACMGIVHNESFISISPFYAISFLGLYCYFAIASLVDIPGKIKILHINLVDYLENHLASRLEQAGEDRRIPVETEISWNFLWERMEIQNWICGHVPL